MITRRRLLTAVPATVALTATAGCELSPIRHAEAEATRDADLSEALDEFLARRTAALDAGDEQAWLADLDPAGSELIAAERWRFANLRQLPLARQRLDGAILRTRHDGTGYVGDARVAFVMRLSIDDDLSVAYSTYTTALVDGTPRIVAIEPGWEEPGGRLGADIPAPAWDLDPLRAATGDDVTVLSGVNSAFDPADYLTEAIRAARHVRAIWRGRVGAPGFVIFLADDEQWVTWFQSGRPLPYAVGAAHFAEIVDEDGLIKILNRFELDRAGIHKASSCARIVLRMSTLTDPDKRYGTLVHEITHASTPQLLRARSLDYSGQGNGSNDQPRWVVEGWAHYVEDTAAGGRERSINVVRRDWRRYKPPAGEVAADNASFYSDDPARIDFNYSLAALYYHAAAQLAGDQGAADLFYAAAAKGTQLSVSSTLMIDQFIEAAGLDPDRFWSTIRQWLA